MSGHLLEQHAREKAGMPGDWAVWLWQTMPPQGNPTLYFSLTGAVAPVKAKGKGKGRRDWEKKDAATERVVIITPAEHDQWVAAWSARTGLCPDCTGEGREIVRAGVDGTTYRPCRGCGGTGKAVPGTEPRTKGG